MNILGQPLPNHSQIRCTTTAGNQMDLGICSECVDAGVSINTCQAILEGIKEYWIYEIDANDQMSEQQKNNLKSFHNSHQIENIVIIQNTGQVAQQEARIKGELE